MSKASAHAPSRLEQLAARVQELEEVLFVIKVERFPTLLRDAREPDKTEDNAYAIYSDCVHAGLNARVEEEIRQRRFNRNG